jgi:hypothetical protein
VAAPAAGAPDTLSPAPGRTFPSLMTPARNSRPWLLAGGAAAVVLVVVLALVNARSGGGNAVVPGPSPLAVPAVVVAPPPPGHARVVVTDADGARIFVDGRLIASGVREAQLPGITPGQPHRLRIEVADRPVYERTFAVAAGADVELQVVTAPPRPSTPPGKRRATITTAPTSTAKPHHRDGLVGDDIFDKK